MSSFDDMVEEYREIHLDDLQISYLECLPFVGEFCAAGKLEFAAMKRAIEKEMGYAQAAAWFPDGV